MRYPENPIDEFYEALAQEDEEALKGLYFPPPSVFMARESYHQYSGERVSLQRMHQAMIEEGLLEDELQVFDPIPEPFGGSASRPEEGGSLGDRTDPQGLFYNGWLEDIGGAEDSGSPREKPDHELQTSDRSRD